MFKRIWTVMKYFYGQAWKMDKYYFLAVIVDMVVTGLQPLIAIIFPRIIIDELLHERRPGVIIQTVAIMVLLFFAARIIGNFCRYEQTVFHQRFSDYSDRQLTRKTMEMDYEYTEDPAMLEMQSKARNGMGWWSSGLRGLTDILKTFTSGIITFVSTLTIIGSVEPLLLIALLALVAIGFLFTYLSRRAELRFKEDRAKLDTKYWYLADRVLQGDKYGVDIRLYDGQQLVNAKAEGYMNHMVKETNRFLKPFVFITSGSLLVTAVQQGVLYGYLGLRVLDKAISIGQFQMLFTASVSFAESITNILTQGIRLATTCDYMNDYIIFMEYPSMKDKGTRKLERNAKHTIAFDRVSFRYIGAERDALTNVSITLETGKKLSLVGENGAGKTTFIKLLARLYEPTEGRILLDGVDIREYPLEEYQKLFSVVFQDFQLFNFTLKENLEFNRPHDAERFDEAMRKAGFIERMNELPHGPDTHIRSWFNDQGVEFSGGEQQKIAIARAIYKDAPIMILDEPTAALDPLAEYKVYHNFNEVISDKTTIYISHRLSSCQFCDTIAVFENGMITQYGSHRQLVEVPGKYGEMFKAQAKYYVVENPQTA
ncbi:ABC transporter ATP-binding protein [Paenibacillus rhizovicinus]|uniref:ABC transporter ATP-binding protein n=1 Tax=Paenibacillus rhizovicinus TaxID=2704463 RepID=A0A6C0P0F1_9BACL|nr:ABC transporter ATP-binding protein [Paenibacillus rhizovicinus]QHW31861.1 ABC transporter ATP-binding protein [Paenibacillus rhizovicinus]